MKYAFVLVCLVFLFSCSDSFVNHELKFEKQGECRPFEKNIQVISNINGERYEFFACLDDDFDGKSYKVDRGGDSILVSFPKTISKKQSLYSLILDIDAKPAYHHIILDGKEIAIIPSSRYDIK